MTDTIVSNFIITKSEDESMHFALHTHESLPSKTTTLDHIVKQIRTREPTSVSLMNASKHWQKLYNWITLITCIIQFLKKSVIVQRLDFHEQ